MTEEEWFASADPAVMGEAVVRKRRATPRALRLYLAAFWAWQSHQLKGTAGQERLRLRAANVGEWAETGVEPAEAPASRTFVGYNTDARAAFTATTRAPGAWKNKNGQRATKRAVWLLHEVFGNPFVLRRKRKTEPRRGWMFDPTWRTDTALTLARQMYAARDFSAMPILADALQDAGCDNEDVLIHCRAPGEHVRGCWVIDLVLGNTWAGLP